MDKDSDLPHPHSKDETYSGTKHGKTLAQHGPVGLSPKAAEIGKGSPQNNTGCFSDAVSHLKKQHSAEHYCFKK